MGFHPLDIIVVVAVALLIFGPKTLQSISHSAGRGVSQAKDVKTKLLAELPMEDISKVTDRVSQIPLSPQEAARKLMTSAISSGEKKASASEAVSDKPAEE